MKQLQYLFGCEEEQTEFLVDRKLRIQMTKFYHIIENQNLKTFKTTNGLYVAYSLDEYERVRFISRTPFLVSIVERGSVEAFGTCKLVPCTEEEFVNSISKYDKFMLSYLEEHDKI